MATARALLQCDTSTLATFKAWAKWISDNLGTFGWVKTTDTGQVDWTVIAAPPTTNNYVYEIWRMDDGATQTAMPVYLRIEYGTNNTLNCPYLAIFLGSGTNGAGTLINPTTRANPNLATSGGAVNTYDCLMAGGNNWFTLMMWRTKGTDNIFMCVERSLDSSGDPNTDFAYMNVAGCNWWGSAQALLKYGVGTYRFSAEGHNNGDVSLLSGSNTAVFPCRPVIGYERNALIGAFRGAKNDWVEGDAPSITLYSGHAHTYYATVGFLGNNYGPVRNSNSALIFRYE